jgi:TPR repeat protein
MHCYIVARVNSALVELAPESIYQESMRLISSGKFVSAAEKLGEGCALGNTRCMAELSWMLCHGRLGLKRQPSRAFELASLGVQTNCPDSMAALSKCLADGCGCEKNLPRSLALAEQSAAAGSRLGHYQLGQLNYNSANFISSKYFLIDNPAMDIEVAVQHFNLAAAQNMPSALVKLGFLREQGCAALPRDHSQAVSLYHAATAFGHPDAYMRLALCYERGRGVPSDRQKAIELYILAHRAGFHDTDRIRHRLFLLNAVIPPLPSSKFPAALSACARLVGASIRPLQWLFGLLISRPLAWLSTKYPSLVGWVAATIKFTAVSAGMVHICCDLVWRDYTLASELSIVPRLVVMSPWLIPTYAFVYELLKLRPSHFLVWLRARSITQLCHFAFWASIGSLIMDEASHRHGFERWSGPPFDAVVVVRIFLDQCYAYMFAAFWYFRYIRPLF